MLSKIKAKIGGNQPSDPSKKPDQTGAMPNGAKVTTSPPTKPMTRKEFDKRVALIQERDQLQAEIDRNKQLSMQETVIACHEEQEKLQKELDETRAQKAQAQANIEANKVKKAANDARIAELMKKKEERAKAAGENKTIAT